MNIICQLKNFFGILKTAKKEFAKNNCKTGRNRHIFIDR